MKTFPFTKTYNSVRVLDYPGYEFESGKIYAVIGANGSGKSTLAKILSGVEKPDSGRTVADVSGIGYMPQKSYAFRLSTEKNILLNGGDRERAKELIEKLRLGNLKHRKAHRLSGGETARMALARILMREYKLLIPDEPTAAMDMESTAASEELIRDYSGRYACPVVLITHSITQAERLADYVLFFSKGILTEDGPADRLLRHPGNPETVKFLDFYGR